MKVPEETAIALLIANDGADERVTVPDDTATTFEVSVTWIAEEAITVGFDESVIVPDETAMALLIANAGADDSVTVGTEESVIVPEETATMLLPVTVTAKALDSVTVPEETATTLLVKVTCTAEDGITVGLLDRVMVPDEIDSAEEIAKLGADESVTVPEETATTLEVRVTCTADDAITVGFELSVTVPEEMASAEEIAIDGAEESVTVFTEDGETVTTLDGITVGLELRITVGLDDSCTVLLVNVTWTADEGVTMPEETATMLVTVVESATAGMPEKLTEIADDGVIDTTEDGVTVPEEIAIALPAAMLPICMTWRWTPPP